MQSFGTRIILTLTLLALFVACQPNDPTANQIVGQYFLEENQYVNDGITCDINIKVRQDFKRKHINSESDLTLKFCFNDSFEFRDMELHYKMRARGEWSYADSLIVLNVDTSSVECDFLGSNAESYTEESMVRNLRKYVNENFIPNIEHTHLFVGAGQMYLDQIDDSSLILSHPGDGRAVLLNRRK